jgi:hypothetical protein
MTIFGKPLSDYVAFSKVFLVLVPIVGTIRLALSLGGVPDDTARWFSMTALVWVAVLYYSVRVHMSRFGSYRHLLVLLAMINVAGQLVSIIGILIAIATGQNNIFSKPEFAFGGDGKTWAHLAAHVFIGTTVGSIFPWVIGSLILAVTRKLSGAPRHSGSLMQQGR